ncbi:MAG TPA: hypothetical protein VE733_18520 [Streptosporangiaceae bacterium]|jgi:hypothetical protein|nr:hypothetical protein [Streptosporangiaceae bacterium]
MAAKRIASESGSPQELDIPGTGPTMTVSTSLHSGTVAAVRNRVGKRGFSAYVEAALRRQIEQDNLAELVDEYTSTEGEFTPEELAAARAELYGTEGASAGHAA